MGFIRTRRQGTFRNGQNFFHRVTKKRERFRPFDHLSRVRLHNLIMARILSLARFACGYPVNFSILPYSLGVHLPASANNPARLDESVRVGQIRPIQRFSNGEGHSFCSWWLLFVWCRSTLVNWYRKKLPSLHALPIATFIKHSPQLPLGNAYNGDRTLRHD